MVSEFDKFCTTHTGWGWRFKRWLRGQVKIYECPKCARKAIHPFGMHAPSKNSMAGCDGECVLVKLKDAW